MVLDGVSRFAFVSSFLSVHKIALLIFHFVFDLLSEFRIFVSSGFTEQKYLFFFVVNFSSLR